MSLFDYKLFVFLKIHGILRENTFIGGTKCETQIENLPMYQLIILKEKIDNIVKNDFPTTDSFEFDILVQHTDRADIADEYIKELRTNDRF